MSVCRAPRFLSLLHRSSRSDRLDLLGFVAAGAGRRLLATADEQQRTRRYARAVVAACQSSNHSWIAPPVELSIGMVQRRDSNIRTHLVCLGWKAR